MSEQHCAENVQLASMPRQEGPASVAGGVQVPPVQTLPLQHGAVAHEPP